MVVLAVLVVVTLLARVAGVAGVAWLRSWPAAVRLGLAAMLLFTAAAHFTSTRHDLARMIPEGIPSPMLVVYLTGVCEILGAIGLLVPRVRRLAGVALIVFLLAVLPANVHAARAGITLQGQPATPLPIRIPAQFLFIALVWWSAVAAPRGSRPDR